MKILIIAHVIYPYQSPRSYRTTELAIELAKNHDVTLIANISDEDYSTYELFRNIRLLPFKKLNFIRKHSTKKESYSIFDKILIKLFRRSLMYPNIEFLWKVHQTTKSINDFDLLISIAAPHTIHWGCSIALHNNKELARKWIADCGDPFMMNQSEKPPFYFSYFEKRFMRRADFVTVPIENAKDAYYPEFRNKIKVIPQGVNFDNIIIYDGEINNKIPCFAYSGVFYKGIRDPKYFFEFLTELKMDYCFYVYTKDETLISNFKHLLKNKLIIKPYIPRTELIFELSKMDFLINFENITKTQSPSKLIDYTLARRPILNVNTENFDKYSFLNFLNRDYKKKIEVDIEDFNISKIAHQFIQLARNNE